MAQLSVLIPTFNRARILEQTLSELTACAGEVFPGEVIVIDNNSSDDTLRVAAKFGSSFRFGT